MDTQTKIEIVKRELRDAQDMLRLVGRQVETFRFYEEKYQQESKKVEYLKTELAELEKKQKEEEASEDEDNG